MLYFVVKQGWEGENSFYICSTVAVSHRPLALFHCAELDIGLWEANCYGTS